MKKGLLLLFAGLMAFGTAVNAMASARLTSLASDDRINEDKDLIFTYANKALEYGNMLDVRLFNGIAGFTPAGGAEWGGLLAKDDSLGVIGAYINRPGLASLAAADPKVDLFWAKSFSGADFGVQVLYANTTTSNDSTYVRDYGVHLGLGLTSDSLNQMNFHAGFETASAAVGGTAAANSPSLITLGTLLEKDLDTNNDMRFFGDLGLTSNPGFTNGASIMNLQLGGAINRKVNDGKGLISSGLIIGYVNTSPGGGGTSNTDYTLAWNANVESQVANWLTLRTGVSKLLYHGNFQGATPIIFGTGASVNWQNFTLDLNVVPQSLENSLANVAPGNGIFINNLSNPNGGDIVVVSQADLSYKF
jgi:hypothetical protein